MQSGGLSPFLRRQIVRTALWDPDSTHPSPLDAETCRHVRNCSFLFQNPSFLGDFFKLISHPRSPLWGRHPDPSSGGAAGEELTHLGILPPSGSWWWYCSTITVTTTDRPTMIMVLAKYWAAESADAGVLPQHSAGNPDGGVLTTRGWGVRPKSRA